MYNVLLHTLNYHKKPKDWQVNKRGQWAMMYLLPSQVCHAILHAYDPYLSPHRVISDPGTHRFRTRARSTLVRELREKYAWDPTLLNLFSSRDIDYAMQASTPLFVQSHSTNSHQYTKHDLAASVKSMYPALKKSDVNRLTKQELQRLLNIKL